jgi:hypothetical protein
MSEEMASSTNPLTIYIPLLNEGATVLRPTSGIKLGENVYRVLPSPGYDPSIEEWVFPPGSLVQCCMETRGGQDVLVARAAQETGRLEPFPD